MDNKRRAAITKWLRDGNGEKPYYAYNNDYNQLWIGDEIADIYKPTVVPYIYKEEIDWADERYRMKEVIEKKKADKVAIIEVEKLLYSAKIKNEKKLNAIKDRLAKLIQVVEIDGEPFAFVPVESLSDIIRIITEVMEDETI